MQFLSYFLAGRNDLGKEFTRGLSSQLRTLTGRNVICQYKTKSLPVPAAPTLYESLCPSISTANLATDLQGKDTLVLWR